MKTKIMLCNFCNNKRVTKKKVGKKEISLCAICHDALCMK